MNDSYRLIEGMIKELMLEQAQQPQQPVADPKDLLNDFMNGIRGISTFELTDKVGAEMSNREYENLLFSSIEGVGYEEKILKLQDILNSKGRDSIQNAKECLAAMSFAKIALKLIYDTNYRRSGYAFETLMAVLMGGKKEESYGPPTSKRSDEDFDIIDITSGDKRYSAKFVSVSSMELKANIVNLYNEIKRNGKVEYIYCTKKEVTKPKDELRLEFNKIVIDEVLFNTVFRELKLALSSDVSGKTKMIDEQLEAGYLRYNDNMKNKFYNYIKANPETYVDGTDGSKLYSKDTVRKGLKVKEAIVTIVLKDISQLNPQKIATLNISINNIRRMFGDNKSRLLEGYFYILTSLADLTSDTNKFIYGNKIGANKVIDSANNLIEKVNFVKNIGEL